MPNQYTNGTALFTPAERFFHYVQFTDTCWLWIGATDAGDYGIFTVNSKTGLAHRWVYKFCVGPIPEGLTLDHLCRVHNCVLPDHLEPVTDRVNILRGQGVSAEHAHVTECPQGHAYNAENTYVHPTKRERRCRTCRREYNRVAGYCICGKRTIRRRRNRYECATCSDERARVNV